MSSMRENMFGDRNIVPQSPAEGAAFRPKSTEQEFQKFIRQNTTPEFMEYLDSLGMDPETYFNDYYDTARQDLPDDPRNKAFSNLADPFLDFVNPVANFVTNAAQTVYNTGQEAAGVIGSVAKGDFKEAANQAVELASGVIQFPTLSVDGDDTTGPPRRDNFIDNLQETADEVIGNVVDSTVSTLENLGGKVADVVADADDATVMDSGAAGGFLRDDITGEGTFLGGANTLMEDDETINYNTDTSESNQGSSGMDSRFEEYYKILREQGPQAAEIYAQNLGLFVEGVGSALFGAARQYTDEQLMSLGRRVGIDDGSVPTIQEITQAGVVLDPSEERRVMDSLMGSQVAGGREFDPAVLQAGIDMNQMMYNRRQPFITAGINASDIAPGIAFGGGIAATMEGALPTFSDIFKMNQADVQNQFNQQLLASQESASDVNRILGTVNALSGAYDANLFGLQDLITNTFENFGRGGNRFEDTRQDRMDSFDDRDPNLFRV